jgi:uncharacterized phage protein gp47/JayE
MLPNSVLRVLSDVMGALCQLTLQYVDWLAKQLLPDTAETEWLDRHGNIWLVNADGTKGRKLATPSVGTATFTGQIGGVTVPQATQLLYGQGLEFETTAAIVASDVPSPAPIRALDPGAAGNLLPGTSLTLVGSIPGIDNSATVQTLDGGTDTETDDQLRARILHRIQNPPMGGAAADYVTWALAVPGVTRAWAAPEQGVGTITVRFLEDDLRADDNGWPTPDDVQRVALYIDQMRPVTVKDTYVVAPIKEFIDVTIAHLEPDTPEAQAEIEQSLNAMLFQKAAPGATIYNAWVSYAIMSAPSVQSFELVTTADYAMPSLGHMAVVGTILYE